VAAPAAGVGLHFNLSRATDFVVCAVADEEEVGVDVEDVTRAVEHLAIAAEFFAPDEVRALDELPAAEQRARFFTLWTLKEAYVKARGMGLSLPLDQFWFRIQPGQAIRISFGDGIVDDPDRWRFTLLQPTEIHCRAIAQRPASRCSARIDGRKK
jgi:4'-phosphopantetheinyl transferase